MGNQQNKDKKKTKGVKPTELQTHIMITQAKLTQARNKKVEIIKRKVKEIVETLNNNNLEIAKAKMESILREEDYITVFDILGPLCEILKEKVTYLLYSKTCPEDLRSPIDTIVYASTRLEIDDLHKVRELFQQKFGDLFVTKANSNADQLVNRKVVEKLKVKPSSENLLIARLKQLCQAEKLDFDWPSEIEPVSGNFANPYVQQFGMSGFTETGQSVNPYAGDKSNINNVYFQNPYQTYENNNSNNAPMINNMTGMSNNGQINPYNNTGNMNPYNNNNINPYNNTVSNPSNYNNNSNMNPHNNNNNNSNMNPYNNNDQSNHMNSGSNDNNCNQNSNPNSNPYTNTNGLNNNNTSNHNENNQLNESNNTFPTKLAIQDNTNSSESDSNKHYKNTHTFGKQHSNSEISSLQSSMQVGEIHSLEKNDNPSSTSTSEFRSPPCRHNTDQPPKVDALSFPTAGNNDFPDAGKSY
jgi:hypothetical protein